MTKEEQERAAQELKKEAVKLAWIFLWIFVGSLIATVLAAGIYCHAQAGFLALLWAIAVSAVGICGGFLFGIPKTVQLEPGTDGSRRTNYRSLVNNNLVDISDWLTKIIIGLGLVNLGEIPALVLKIAHVLSDSLEKCGSCGCSEYLAFSAGLIIGFVSLGFIFGYLFMRLYLAPAFIRADIAGQAQATEGETVRPLDEPLEIDSEAADGGGIESKLTATPTGGEEKAEDGANAGRVVAPTEQKAAGSILVPPDPNALTKEECKMLNTLWPHQKRYLMEKENKLWGFGISENAPDYSDFVLGYRNLSQRGLVSQGDKGLVFLTDIGIRYCSLFEERLKARGGAWSKFSPA